MVTVSTVHFALKFFLRIVPTCKNMSNKNITPDNLGLSKFKGCSLFVGRVDVLDIIE